MGMIAPEHELLLNSMNKIINKLESLEEVINVRNQFKEFEGMKLQEIAEIMKVSVSRLRRCPWLLPFDEPDYGRNPIVYSRVRVLEHLKFMQDKRSFELKRAWERNNIKKGELNESK